jgi:subtilisin family serine protease
MAMHKRITVSCLLAGVGLLTACGDATTTTPSTVRSYSTPAERYIIAVNNQAGRAAVEQAGQVVLELPELDAVAANIPEAALTALQNNPNIGDIELDQKRYLSSNSADRGQLLFQQRDTDKDGVQDFIQMVQGDQVPAGDNVTVCIIDSGFSQTHEALDHLSATSSADSGTGDPFYDDNGHGTHVAGTIGGYLEAEYDALGNLMQPSYQIGVAPHSVSLHIVKVFTKDGWAYSSSLQSAAYKCKDEGGAKIISMSLGGTMKSRFEQLAFQDLADQGVLSIAAAGNDGNNRKSFPASYDAVMSVAAVDASATAADFSQYNSQVEIAAPGVQVLSTTPWNSTNALTIGSEAPLTGGSMEGGAEGTATGELATSGLCDSTDPALAGKIALCQRGSISFADKVANAEASGAIATVVYNNVDGGFSGTLGDASSQYPAITLSKAEGDTLATRLANGETLTATVTSTFEFPASGYEAWDGTSMATPHVSGVAALVWGNFPSASAQDIRDALDASALDLGTAGRDDHYGFGLAQAKAAYDYLSGAGPVCTITETTETTCDDGIDNDCDDLIDADDDDCAPSCTPTEQTETSCGDGMDNDCDGDIDDADSDCKSGPTCDLGQPGDSCSSGADCCSGKCKGKPGQETCR